MENNNVSSRRRYTPEFKISVVQEHLSGKTLTELSKKYLIPTSTLGTWTSQLRGEVENPKDKIQELEDRIKDLVDELDKRDKEVSRLKEEVEEISTNVPEDVQEAVLSHKKDQDTIKSLNEEVISLHEDIARLKEEAKREIRTLKDAIVIMAKEV